MKKEFKYRSEVAINMFLSRYQVLQQAELKAFAEQQNAFDDLNPCNFYFILKRPRLSINPDGFAATNEFINIDYYIHVQDEKIGRTIKIPNSWQTAELALNSEYPYKFFKICCQNGECDYFKLGALLDQVQFNSPIKEPLLDYEVLYIGQAYGEDGKRTAMDRLDSHSTLQKIYAEAIDRNPDSEIWLMLASFTQRSIASMNGRINIPVENEEDDVLRFASFIDPDYASFTEKQRINFTEAALIKTFKPRYNKEYKETFPSPSHSSYSECYSLDINGIVVETNTSDMSRWLYTSEKPRIEVEHDMFNYWQHGLFHFVNDEDRYEIFNNEYL